jgi:hypothetical protein
MYGSYLASGNHIVVRKYDPNNSDRGTVCVELQPARPYAPILRWAELYPPLSGAIC